jgi:PAP2 superfamily
MRLTRGWKEAAAFVALYEVYETARGHIHPAAGPALRHAEALVALERRLGIYQEGRVQRAFIEHPTAVQFWDIYYGTVHFVVPAVALWLLWRRGRDRFGEARTAFLVMCFLALGVFIAWPLMPPRYMPSGYGFVDTTARFGGLGPLDSGSMKDTNPFAAMPSLHIGWSVWSAWVLVSVLSSRRARVLAVAYPLVTLTAIVATANHWVLDAAGGVATFAAAVGIVRLAGRRSPAGGACVEGHDGRILGRGAPAARPGQVVRPAGAAASGLRKRRSERNLHAR